LRREQVSAADSPGVKKPVCVLRGPAFFIP
jgi:hypothetical protein